MSVKTRMGLVVALLTGLVFAVLMAFSFLLAYAGVVSGGFALVLPVLMTLGWVTFLWAVGPLIIRWIYKIRWVEDLEGELPAIAAFIRRTCARHNLPAPRFGVIEDDNPNAFTYGWTRRHANLVITRGVLRFCDEDEQLAVVGHEMGHIVHNDYVVMTVIAAVPLVLYSIYVGARQSANRVARKANSKAGAGAASGALTVALMAYLAYLVSQFLVLLVSRYRESWADEFSARETRRPDTLASALVKICYGIAIENAGQGPHNDAKRRYSSALMFASAAPAQGFAASAIGPRGHVDRGAIKRAMAWDMWNPWAKWAELFMTHPLPGRRINDLGELALEMGEEPYVDFDLKQPESYIDEFLWNILMMHSWWIVGVAVFLLTAGAGIAGLILSIAAAVGARLAYLLLYRYPFWFRPSNVKTLVADPEANPVKGTPVILRGRVIGRGRPGIEWEEDVKIQDATGLMLVDYRSGTRFGDFLVGAVATGGFVGKEVVVSGWYRRYVVPYVELFRMEADDRKLTSPFVPLAVAVTVFLGGVFLVLAVALL